MCIIMFLVVLGMKGKCFWVSKMVLDNRAFAKLELSKSLSNIKKDQPWKVNIACGSCKP